MKKNDDFRFYVQIPNFLTSEKCQQIIDGINDNEDIVDGCVADDLTEHRENTIIPEVRITKESYLLEQPQDYNNRAIPELDWNWLSDKMFQMVQLVNDKSFKFDIQEIDKELKYIEYGFGGHYNWHMDLNPTDSNTRKLTAVVQLNDEYEGGYLEFGVQDRKGEWFKVPKMKGSITIFPCFLSHRVSPVTKGKRHVVQELYLGDAFV